jgi:hypothetical protein
VSGCDRSKRATRAKSAAVAEVFVAKAFDMGPPVQ